ncbi:MAG TPA: helix-turn-helix transcriptional regulator, partial [Xanthobacteraceae bacterium]|nr:helix-turn-helix transcriptional regulator [Xanthobacteraceae bacterium]
MNKPLNEYLTTTEAADYLRLSERKLYELVSENRIPCTKATGKWLFPKAALDQWLVTDLNGRSGLSYAAAPPIVGGSHDPLLEWALRESKSGLALLPEGSEAGLRRLRTNEAMIAGVHLHAPEGPDDDANLVAVSSDSALADCVVIAWCRREQGIVVPKDNPLGLTNINDIARKRARIAERQTGAGAQALLIRLCKLGGIDLQSLQRGVVARTGDDLALAVRESRVDCGIATRATAATRGLDFVSLAWERFDLVTRRKNFFEPAMQALLTFAREPVFRERAAALGGYDVADVGKVLL